MDEEEYKQILQMNQIKNTPYANPMNNYQGSIVYLTNPENELYKMELALRNMMLDKKGNAIKVGDPLMNDLGISSVVGQVQSIVNQVTVMSNFEDKDIPMMIDFLGDTLAKDLMMNRIIYGISNISARDKIFFISLSCAFVTMKRALDEGEKRFWKGSTQEITTRVEGLGGSRKKVGFLGLGSLANAWK